MTPTGVVLARRELRLPLTTGAAPTTTWAAAVTAAQQMCLVLDDTGHLVAASIPTRAALGPQAEVGRSCDDFWVEESAVGTPASPSESLLRRAAAAAQPVHTFVRLRAPSGVLPAEVIAVPLGGRPSGLLVFLLGRSNGSVPAA